MISTVINNNLKTREGLRYLIELSKTSHFDSAIDAVTNAKAILTQLVQDSKQSPCCHCAWDEVNPTLCNAFCNSLPEYDRLRMIYDEDIAIGMIVCREIDVTINYPIPAPIVVVNYDDDNFMLPF